MSRKVFKEIVIALLLCLAIILITALLLYNYVPARKVLPNEIAYRTPEWINKELMSSETDDDRVVMTYEVNGTDMNNYENINSYNPGRANPFEDFTENENVESDKKTTESKVEEQNSNNSDSNKNNSQNNSQDNNNANKSNNEEESEFYNYKNGK